MTQEQIPSAPIPPPNEFYKTSKYSKVKVEAETLSCDANAAKPEFIAEWRKSFGKQLFENETLIRVFRCALAKPALLEGKMYISDHHLAFRLNWPSQTCFILEYSSIIDIRKASFAQLLPNALEVETETEVYFFGSMTGRGEKYILLHQLWDQHVQPTSLYRKFPDMSVTKCACLESGTCEFCLKTLKLKNSETLKRNNGSSLARKKMDLSSNTQLNSAHSLDMQYSARNQSANLLSPSNDEVRSASPGSPPANMMEDADIGSISLSKSGDSLNTLSNSGQAQASLKNDQENCQCNKSTDYELAHESTLPFSIETLWNEWFCTPSEGNAFYRFLINDEKVTAIEVGPWAPAGDASGIETIPLDQINGSKDYCPEFSSLKVGMNRRITRVIPLKHSIPFVPKSTPGEANFSILSVGPKSLCMRAESSIILMGIMTDLKFCLAEERPGECRLKVYLKIEFTGKGKINVPKALAEKSTAQGVQTFYENLTAYFKKNIQVGHTATCSCEKLGQQENLDVWYSSDFLPISIEEVWEKLFQVPTTGNVFTKYVQGRAGWTDMEFQPWKKANEAQEEFCSIGGARKAEFVIPFNQVEAGLYRNLKYNNLSEKPVPFVPPKISFQGVQTVENQAPHSLCMKSLTESPEFGIEYTNRICITSYSPSKTKIRILGRFNISSGKYPLPEAWKDVPSKITTLYSELISQYLIFVPDQPSKGKGGKTRKREKVVHVKGRVLERIKEFSAKLVSMAPTHYSDYLLGFLFIMLLFNTLILWNLVVNAERSQEQIRDLTRQLAEMAMKEDV